MKVDEDIRLTVDETKRSKIEWPTPVHEHIAIKLMQNDIPVVKSQVQLMAEIHALFSSYDFDFIPTDICKLVRRPKAYYSIETALEKMRRIGMVRWVRKIHRFYSFQLKDWKSYVDGPNWENFREMKIYGSK